MSSNDQEGNQQKSKDYLLQNKFILQQFIVSLLQLLIICIYLYQLSFEFSNFYLAAPQKDSLQHEKFCESKYHNLRTQHTSKLFKSRSTLPEDLVEGDKPAFIIFSLKKCSLRSTSPHLLICTYTFV